MVGFFVGFHLIRAKTPILRANYPFFRVRQVTTFVLLIRTKAGCCDLENEETAKQLDFRNNKKTSSK